MELDRDLPDYNEQTFPHELIFEGFFSHFIQFLVLNLAFCRFSGYRSDISVHCFAF